MAQPAAATTIVITTHPTSETTPDATTIVTTTDPTSENTPEPNAKPSNETATTDPIIESTPKPTASLQMKH